MLLKLSIKDLCIHNGKPFSQIGGVAIDNPLSPTLANWYLEMIEKEIFNQHLSFHSSFHVRYVDVFIRFSIHQQKFNFF